MALRHLVLLTVIGLVAFELHSVDATCCKADRNLKCKDGTTGDPCCSTGTGRCNWLCCGCPGACRTTNKRRNSQRTTGAGQRPRNRQRTGADRQRTGSSPPQNKWVLRNGRWQYGDSSSNLLAPTLPDYNDVAAAKYLVEPNVNAVDKNVIGKKNDEVAKNLFDKMNEDAAKRLNEQDNVNAAKNLLDEDNETPAENLLDDDNENLIDEDNNAAMNLADQDNNEAAFNENDEDAMDLLDENDDSAGVMNLIEMADQDQDGRLSYDEVHEYLGGSPLERSKRHADLQALDLNSDLHLTADEIDPDE